MTVLVTGASGFLGGALTHILTRGDETVRILARPTSDLSHVKALPIETTVGDLSNPAILREAVSGVSIIYHCAALSADWGSEEDFERANVTGVRNLLEATRIAGQVDRFVHVSTTDVYGYPRQSCDETAGMTDVGLPYNSTKIAGENLVKAAHLAAGLPVTIVRPATIFGPRSPDFVVEMGRLLLEGELPLIGGGRSQAGLIYADDVATAMIAAAHTPETMGKAYNLRDPQPMTWIEYASALADGIGVAPPSRSLPSGLAWAAGWTMEAAYRLFRSNHRPLLTRHAVHILSRPQDYGIGKAQRDFGFAPAVGLKEGIKLAVAWLLSNEGKSALRG